MQGNQVCSLFNQMSKVKRSSKKVEDIFNITTKGTPEFTNKNLNKYLKMKYRRKNESQQQKKISFIHLKNKYHNGRSTQQRNSYFSANSEPQNEQKSAVTTVKNLSSQRGHQTLNKLILKPTSSGPKFKPSVKKKQEKDEEQLPKIKKLLLNWQKKVNYVQNKTSFNNTQHKRFKNVSLVNKTTNNSDSFFEEQSFVDLISKFRFQNLKTYDQSKQSHKNTRKKLEGITIAQKTSYNQPFLFLPSEAEEKSFKKFQNQKKLISSNNNEQVSSSKVKRRVSVLTPWQNENAQFGNNCDFI